MVNRIPMLAEMTQNIVSFRTLLALGLFMLGFAGIYTYVPDRKLTLKSQIPARVCHSRVDCIFHWYFSLYFRLFGKPEFFLYVWKLDCHGSSDGCWLYGCICLLFFGAENQLVP